MDITNKKPGGQVNEVLGVSLERLEQIVKVMGGIGNPEFDSSGDLLIHNFQFCETTEEMILMSYLVGGFDEIIKRKAAERLNNRLKELMKNQ